MVFHAVRAAFPFILSANELSAYREQNRVAAANVYLRIQERFAIQVKELFAVQLALRDDRAAFRADEHAGSCSLFGKLVNRKAVNVRTDAVSRSRRQKVNLLLLTPQSDDKLRSLLRLL